MSIPATSPAAPPCPALEAASEYSQLRCDTGWLGRHISWLRCLTRQDKDLATRLLAIALICCEIAASILTVIGLYFLYQGINEWRVQEKIKAAPPPPISTLPPHIIETISANLPEAGRQRFALAGASRKTPNILAGICNERKNRLVHLSADPDIQRLHLLVLGDLLDPPDILSQKDDSEILRMIRSIQKKVYKLSDDLPPSIKPFIRDIDLCKILSNPEEFKEFLDIIEAVNIEFIRCAFENMDIFQTQYRNHSVWDFPETEKEICVYNEIKAMQRKASAERDSLPEAVKKLLEPLDIALDEVFSDLIASSRASNLEVVREQCSRIHFPRMAGRLFRTFPTKEALLEEGKAYRQQRSGTLLSLDAILIMWTCYYSDA